MYPPQVRNFPQDLASPGRRRFLGRLGGMAAAATVLPLLDPARVEARWAGLDATVTRLGQEPEDEDFWIQVKEQFPVRKDLVLINAANLCPSPFTVQQGVFDLTRDIDRDASFNNRAKFEGLRETARTRLAAFLGADPEEIALVRNTSEGNNTVISGLDLGAGDEVVIWDQNHPTANVAWDVRAARYGYRVVRVATPESPADPGELLSPFLSAISPRTRVVAFSHVSNVSGQRIPAVELCAEAQRRGILSLVDGAQTFGCCPVDLHALGCDFYTGSSHKWFCGPKEVGVLYVRREVTEQVHPLIVGVGWEGAERASARRFETLGQRDDARVAAMGTAVDFLETVGMPRIAVRVPQLAEAVKRGLRSALPGVRMITPLPSALSWGVVVFHVPGLDTTRALDALYERGVGCAVMGQNIRFSPHIYNTLEEVKQAVVAVAELAGGGR